MSNKMVCRVCAVDSVRMYTIVDTEIKRVYEKLTNIDLHADSRPLTVCYFCHSQLRTTQQLMLKALKVEEILNPILNGEVQMSTVDRQAHKLTNSLLVSRTEHMSIELPLCNKVVKVEPPEECVGGEDQQEHLWTEIFIKEEPVFDNPGNDATQSNPTGVSEQRLTRDQERCVEKDTGRSIIKKEPVCDNHNSLLKAVPADDAPHSYDVKFVVRRETTNVATYGRKRKDVEISIIKEEPVCDHHHRLWKANPEGDPLQSYDIQFEVRRETTNVATYGRKRKDAPLELKPKLRQPEYVIKREPPQITEQTENAGTKAHDEETCLNVSKSKIEMKTNSEINLERDTYICNDCNMEFNSKILLLKHIRKHVPIKTKKKLAGNLKPRLYRHACHICGHKFSNTGNLKVHIRSHTGEKPYACNMCHYKCTYKSSLKIHMRTHTGEKPYACHICDYRCAQVSSMKSHLRKHTGDKPYACHLCDLKYMGMDYLRRHLRKQHIGDKPYACHMCDLKYMRMDYLRRHLRTQHIDAKPYLPMLFR